MIPPPLYNQAPKKMALFLGYFSFETVMLIILGIHAFFCICLVANASSVVEFSYRGLKISTNTQLALATWGLLGVLAITAALVGWYQQREFPMAVYFWYLFVTTILVIALMFWVASTDWECSLVQEDGLSEKLAGFPSVPKIMLGFSPEDMQSQRIGFSFLCTVLSAAVLLVGLAIVAVVLFALYTIYQVQATIHETVLESLSETSRLLLREKQNEISKAYWS
eukprot:s581_g3.t1